jgi:hypothetical protein
MLQGKIWQMKKVIQSRGRILYFEQDCRCGCLAPEPKAPASWSRWSPGNDGAEAT